MSSTRHVGRKAIAIPGVRAPVQQLKEACEELGADI